jgi:hypothetical protein
MEQKQKLNGNFTNQVMATKPFHVKEDHIYNYTVSAEAKNVSSYSAVAAFRTSSDVSENSTRYGSNASNGRVLSLSPGSEIHARVDIVKPSNYTIALRAKVCASCTFLKITIEPDNNDTKYVNNSIRASNISLENNNSELKWLYSNSTYPLKKGTYEFKIYSDTQTDLDSVVIYPIDKNNSSRYADNKKHNQTLEDLFTLGKYSSQPAQISEYKKINPTKHIVKINNATNPYMLVFAESYDPLWTAYVDNSEGSNRSDGNESNNYKINSIPLYGLTNGFYVNRTGDYSLVIEYQPQEWFIQGATISILFLVSMFAGLLLLRKRRTMRGLYLTVIKTLSKYRRDKNTDRVKR